MSESCSGFSCLFAGGLRSHFYPLSGVASLGVIVNLLILGLKLMS